MHHLSFTLKFIAWLPFLTLRSTPGVVTNSVPRVDDGNSLAISIPTGFPIGNSNQSVAYVSIEALQIHVKNVDEHCYMYVL